MVQWFPLTAAFLVVTIDGFSTEQLNVRTNLPSNSNTKLNGEIVSQKVTNSRRAFFISTAGGILVAAPIVTSSKITAPQSMMMDTITNRITGEVPLSSLQPMKSQVQVLTSVKEALKVIENSCNRKFLHTVVSSDYNFLYRGIPSTDVDKGGLSRNTDTKLPSVRIEPYDLLSPDTYGSVESARFFQKLDLEMAEDPVQPHQGHLAVTSSKAASDWGTPASVWPLGEDGVYFAWFKDGGTFWPRPVDSAHRTNMIVDGLNCGQFSLEDAMREENTEVLFSSNSFLVVPISLENELRKGLKSAFIM